ncbi:MAG: transketolase C-terminal domain-containing protein [Candidatus Paceibacterota bacterium]
MQNDNKKLASMRAGFGEGLVIAGEANAQVVGLCADLAESTGMLPFKQKFPERYIEVGVAEQNLATVASGMASMGKIPFMASYAVFSPGRNWEQIRTTICYNNLPVKIIGTHAGLNVGPDGGSHQALEDIALMRSLPRMVVVSPCDAIEAKKTIIEIAKTNDPTYVRLVREKSPVITNEEAIFKIGKAQIVYEKNGSKSGSLASVGIIATGPILYKALMTAKKLTNEGIDVTVMNLSTIKPLDEQAIIKLAHKTGAIVTVEEHQIHGGMGSAVAECLSTHFPTPIEFVGVKDVFGQSGQSEELLELYGLGEKDIYKAIHKVILKK